MKAIILAAGQGKRMRSSTPKLLYPIMGKPFLKYISEACHKAGIADITLVVSADSKAIKNTMGEGLKYTTQAQPLGTGHAVLAAAEHIKPDDDILILAGDMPLITQKFICSLIEFYKQKSCAAVVASVYMHNIGDFGRVYVKPDGQIESIVEAKDMRPDSPQTQWGNTSIYIFKGEALLHGLKYMKNDNNQGEYYLTDVPKILHDAGKSVYVFQTMEDETTFIGINTQAQLAQAALYMRNRINARHMENGVQMLDPATTYIDDTVQIEKDVVLYPGCVLEGETYIGSGSLVGPYTHMQNTVIDTQTTVQQSVLKDTKIGSNTTIGPFAYLRPGAVVGNNCRVGNFVEIKNANLGDGVKAAHLAYIGDADVGCNVNYSCGAITANYDGKNKYRTTIADGAFIGCNANLVAPVSVGAGAFVAAGSTITDDIPEYSMGIARQKQVTKDGWVKDKLS